MFNVIIIGGEFTEDYDFFQERCIYFLKEKAKSGCGIKILTCGDAFVEKFTKRFGINTKYFLCDWNTYGKDALKVRNRAITKEADALIFFDCNKNDLTCLYNYFKTTNKPIRCIKKNEE